MLEDQMYVKCLVDKYFSYYNLKYMKYQPYSTLIAEDLEGFLVRNKSNNEELATKFGA